MSSARTAASPTARSGHVEESLNHVVVLVAVLITGCAGAVTPSAGADNGALRTSPADGGLAHCGSSEAARPRCRPAGSCSTDLKADEVEDYFTIDTDGTDAIALFTLQGCGCARLSPDGTHIWTMGQTEHGTPPRLTTMRLDGSEREVFAPPSETLNLGPRRPARTDGGSPSTAGTRRILRRTACISARRTWTTCGSSATGTTSVSSRSPSAPMDSRC